jgi:hypothetical protein
MNKKFCTIVPPRQILLTSFVTGSVTDCDGFCNGLAFYKQAHPGQVPPYFGAKKHANFVKLLEGFGQSGWAPSLARILENKQQMKERMKQ